MFTSSLQNALIFTVHTIFSTYIMIVLFRFLLQLVRGSFNNPLAQFAIRATNPLLLPLRKIIPGFAKTDFAAIVLMLAIQCLELYLILLIRGFSTIPTIKSMLGLLIWSFGEILDMFFVFLFFITILQVILSFTQSAGNTGASLVNSLTRPFFRPIRKILPNFGALDFTPLVVIFLIILARMIVVDPIIFYARDLI